MTVLLNDCAATNSRELNDSAIKKTLIANGFFTASRKRNLILKFYLL